MEQLINFIELIVSGFGIKLMRSDAGIFRFIKLDYCWKAKRYQLNKIRGDSEKVVYCGSIKDFSFQFARIQWLLCLLYCFLPHYSMNQCLATETSAHR